MKNRPRIAPAIAKIVYEFLFLVAGRRRLFHPGNDQALMVLVNMLNNRSLDDVERCFRRSPPNEGFHDGHGIRLESGSTHCFARVILFGNVDHLIIIPSMNRDILDEVAVVAKQPVIGVEYLQRIATKDKFFRAITPNGKAIPLSVD